MPKKDHSIGIIRVILNASNYIYEKMSKAMDSIIYNRTGAMIASLLAAIIITAGVNYGEIRSRIFHENRTSVEITDVRVETLYDSNLYDVKGIPSRVDVTLVGEPADIQTYRNEGNIRVVADLREQNEGESTVEFRVANLPDTIQVTINPKEANATLSEKITKEFSVTPELMLSANQKANNFEVANLKDVTVNVTGSQTKVDSIRSVKAVIDTAGYYENFEANATLVAYDGTGNTVDVKIEPSTVKVNVKVRNVE